MEEKAVSMAAAREEKRGLERRGRGRRRVGVGGTAGRRRLQTRESRGRAGQREDGMGVGFGA